MRKKLLKRIGLTCILAGIISILVSSTVLAAPFNTSTDDPKHDGPNVIYVKGKTESSYKYSIIECQTQLWYYDTSWHWLDTDTDTKYNAYSAYGEIWHEDVASIYQGMSNHFWWNPGGDYGTYTSYSEVVSGL